MAEDHTDSLKETIPNVDSGDEQKVLKETKEMFEFFLKANGDTLIQMVISARTERGPGIMIINLDARDENDTERGKAIYYPKDSIPPEMTSMKGGEGGGERGERIGLEGIYHILLIKDSKTLIIEKDIRK